MSYHIRPIQARDNRQVASVIRNVMTEHGAVGEGYSIQDPEVDRMFETYERPGHAFFVVEIDGSIEGCGGIGTLPAAPSTVCELKKMYFMPPLRGLGAGRALAEHCLTVARKLNYAQCYLETLESMATARHLYLKLGFHDVDQPVGNTGHCACDRWMLLDLAAYEPTR